MPLRFLTSGESHGKLLTSILEGIPSGLELTSNDIDFHLARRQKGYGRGGRMEIEHDRVEINSGVRHGKTIGSPISLVIKNKDWDNWKDVMSIEHIDMDDPAIIEKMAEKEIKHVRPGHADLTGILKYSHEDIRNVLERSSARETAARVAVGSVCLKLLQHFGMDIFSHVLSIGSAHINIDVTPENLIEAKNTAYKSPVSCIDSEIEKLMVKEIDIAKESGDTLGGIIQIIASGIPVGLGSYVHWDRRIDAEIARAIMSIPAIKSVGIGLGKAIASLPGSSAHDEIYPKDTTNEYVRLTNHSGGIEGGMTTGTPIIVRAAMKPIPTLKKPLKSINIYTGKEHLAHYERSDVCAVPAAGVVCEAMLAIVLANAFLEKFGGDSITEISYNFNNFKKTYQNR
ncbi:MAG: chorismate synthase [Cyanobacteriota bacterium]